MQCPVRCSYWYVLITTEFWWCLISKWKLTNHKSIMTTYQSISIKFQLFTDGKRLQLQPGWVLFDIKWQWKVRFTSSCESPASSSSLGNDISLMGILRASLKVMWRSSVGVPKVSASMSSVATANTWEANQHIRSCWAWACKEIEIQRGDPTSVITEAHQNTTLQLCQFSWSTET